MKNRKLRIANYTIALLTLLVIACLYPSLPSQIPTQWGFDGHVSYGPKSTIWMMGGMFVLFAFLFDFMPKIDPRKRNYQKFGQIYDVFCVGLQVFLAITTGIILSESFAPGRINAPKIILLMLSILFLCLGNSLPKIQSNFFMGIKTPWTLSSEDVWRRTHRLAGKLYVGCGIILLGATLFLPLRVTAVLLIVLVLGSSIAVFLASYLWWRGQSGQN